MKRTREDDLNVRSGCGPHEALGDDRGWIRSQVRVVSCTATPREDGNKNALVDSIIDCATKQ